MTSKYADLSRPYKPECGDAAPIECRYCDFSCVGAENMARHERVHRRRQQ